MSTNNTTPTPPNSSPCLFWTPSEAFVAGRWGKSSEKPAEKQVGLDKANQLAAENLLDLVNSDVVEVLKLVATPIEPLDPLANATVETVITSADAVTSIKRINIKKGKKSRDYCQVVLIDKISPKDITADQIRSFCSRMGIKGLRHASKKKCFDFIADHKDKQPKKKVPETLSNNHVNRKRYFNVLFSEEICPKLATRGES